MSGVCAGGGEPEGLHVIHLLAAERELLEECHWSRFYLGLCGAELPVPTLPSSLCEPGCERMIDYCVKCVQEAAGWNAEAGLGSPAGVGR